MQYDSIHKEAFINKLQRLNKTDLEDLKFLYLRNHFSLDEVVKGIREKSLHLYGNKYYLDDIIVQKMSKHISKFKFLKYLYEELK